MALLEVFGPALMGGALIGLAAGGLYLLTGRIAGVSGVVGGAVLLERGVWRYAFVAGLIAAGVGGAALHIQPAQALSGVAWQTLGASGVVVGLGAAIGSGCTSGHGVCGLGRLSSRSLAAVVTFMTSAALTVFVARHGIAP